MDLKARFSTKLDKLLFTEIRKETKIGEYILEDNIYMPLKSENLVGKVKEGNTFNEIPISLFVEGMFFVLGVDDEFKYKSEYIEILKSIDMSRNFIKSKIAELVKNEGYEDAFIYLKGLSKIEETKDVYEKLLYVLDILRSEDKIFESEELKIINRAKSFEKFATPYLYEAIILRDQGDFLKALSLVNEYELNGGKVENDIAELKQNLISINQYDKGKELVVEEPETALKVLIPLLPVLGDNAEIYYYVAIAYRNLGNHEKAIYYLNEASAINNSILEVLNEYGINYASLRDFESALNYFEKAFSENKSIELCTNIIMCYLHLNDLKGAEEYIAEAEKINPNDEVLMDIKKIMIK